MLKKLAIALFVICTSPFLSPGFRAGFKEGWNEKYDEFVARDETPIFFRKFKNV